MLIFISFLTIILSTSVLTEAGIKVKPAQLILEMNNGYPENDITTSIGVTNPYSYDIQASARVITPWDFTENYVFIPDSSWIEVYPKTIDVPANSSEKFYITLKIPENEKPLHYNESWEVWILVTPHLPSKVEGQMGLALQVQYAIKILISTPPIEKGMQTSRDIYIFFVIFLMFTGFILVILYSRNKKKIQKNCKAAIFYVKKNDNKN